MVLKLLSVEGGETKSNGLVASGYLKTVGSEIVDAKTGEAVRLVGANWFGAEGTTKVPGGLWMNNYRDMMDQMVDAGLNALRIPISPEILDGKAVGTGVRFDLNPDLKGLTGIQVLDKIVEYAGQIGLRIIIDMHRIDAGTGKQESGLWFNSDYSLQDLAADWKTVAARYAGDPTVVGVDLFNEPSNQAHWADPTKPAQYDWQNAATVLGNAVQSVNPDLLIFVEGNHLFDNKWYWVGGNLKGVADNPVDLNVDNRVVYSPHDYPYSVQNVPWLLNATPAQIRANFEAHWGYIYNQGIAPIAIGETGGKLTAAADKLYFDTLFDYLDSTQSAAGSGSAGMSLFWWGWNPNSGDTGGLLQDDWQTLQAAKIAYLDRLNAEALPTTDAAVSYSAGAKVTLTFEMTQNVGTERIYLFDLDDGTAIAGQDYIDEQGVLRFLPGQTTASITVNILNDGITEGAETFFVNMSYVSGLQFASFKATILDQPGNGTGTTPPPVSNDPMASPINLRGARLSFEADADNPNRIVLHLDSTNGTLGDWALRIAPKGSDPYSMAADTDFATLPRAGGAILIAPQYNWQKSATSVDIPLLLAPDSALGVTSLSWAATSGLRSSGSVDEHGNQSGVTGDLDVTFSITQQWGKRFFASVTVTNDGTQDMTKWVLKLESDQFDILDAHTVRDWFGTDGEIRVAAPNWDPVLSAGESFTFGIDGRMFADPLDVNLPSLQEFVEDHSFFLV